MLTAKRAPPITSVGPHSFAYSSTGLIVRREQIEACQSFFFCKLTKTNVKYFGPPARTGRCAADSHQAVEISQLIARASERAIGYRLVTIARQDATK
jgi:hypothetical protein